MAKQTTAAAQNAQLTVNRPDKGETETYAIKPGMTIAVHGFTFGDGVATIRGEDLVIQFPDGSQIVLQDFVEVAQYNNPPVVVFDDGTVLPGADVLQQVAALEGAPLEVTTADAGANVANIEPAAGPAGNASNLVSGGGLGSAANFSIGGIGGDGVAVSARPDNVDFGRATDGFSAVGGPTGDNNGGGTPPGGNNTAPDAYNATLVVDDDAPATNLNIPAPTDANGDTLTITINSLPGLGTLLLNGVPVVVGQVLTVAQLQALQFDPANGQFGNTSFTYTVNDGRGGSDVGTVNINVNEQDGPANTAPEAYDATLVVDDDAAATNLNIPAPTDANGDTLTITINSLPGLGTLMLNGVPVVVGQVLTVAQLQALQFDPANGQFGNTSFTYTVNDGNGGVDTGTVNINVNEQDGPANTAPEAYDATLVVDDDAAATNLNIPAPTDANGDTLSITINSLPSLGVLMLNGVPVTVGQVLTVAQLQALQFDPANGQFGNTSFTYTVNDGNGGVDTGTVNINVNEQNANNAPDAYDATLVVDDDAAATNLNIPAPTDADGDSLTVTINTLPGLGTLMLNGVPVVAGQVLTVAQLQALQFDPANGQFGNTSFTYTVNDGHGGTDTATVNINVNEQNANQAPVAYDATLVVDDDAAATNLNIPAPTDADGNTLSITINSLPSLGTLLLNGVPVVVGQVLTVAQLQALQFDPANGQFGNTSFGYTVNDGHGGTDTGVVNINVNEQDPANNAPVAYDATLVVDDDAAATNLNIPAPTDVDGDSLTVTINTLPSLGTLMLNGVPVVAGQVLTVAQLQALQFDPANGQFGNTSFTYTVNDGNGATDSATVNINVNEQDAANHAPDAFNATLVVDDDAAATNLNIPAPVDADGDVLSVTINSLPSLGTLLLNGVPVVAGQVLTVAQLQALQFDPANGQFGNTSFNYTVNDGHGGTDTATVNINVNEQDVQPVNHNPDAFNATLVVDDDAGATALNIPRPVDVDGDTLTVTINSLPGLGTLLLNGVAVHAGQVLTVAQLQALSFDPQNNQFGNTSFTYTVNDGHGGSDTATVNINVNEQDTAPVNHNPNAFNATLVVDDDASATALNIPRPVDPDGHSLTVTINNLPGLGTLLLNGVAVHSGQVLTVAQLQALSFDPQNNQFGNTSFTYTVNDGHGGSDTATVNINVNEQDGGGSGSGNHAPVALNQTIVMNEDQGNVALNIARPTDVDGDVLSVRIDSLPGLGTLMLNGHAVTVGQVMTVAQLQSLTFQTAPDANGTATFHYTATDSHGASDGATVNLVLNPMPDALAQPMLQSVVETEAAVVMHSALESALVQDGYETAPAIGPLHELAVAIAEQQVASDFGDYKGNTWQFDEAHAEIEFGKVYGATVSEEAPSFSGHVGFEPQPEQIPVVALWDTLPAPEPVHHYQAV